MRDCVSPFFNLNNDDDDNELDLVHQQYPSTVRLSDISSNMPSSSTKITPSYKSQKMRRSTEDGLDRMNIATSSNLLGLSQLKSLPDSIDALPYTGISSQMFVNNGPIKKACTNMLSKMVASAPSYAASEASVKMQSKDNHKEECPLRGQLNIHGCTSNDNNDNNRRASRFDGNDTTSRDYSNVEPHVLEHFPCDVYTKCAEKSATEKESVKRKPETSYHRIPTTIPDYATAEASNRTKSKRKFRKHQLKKAFDSAVRDYQLEIYKNRYENANTNIFAKENERNKLFDAQRSLTELRLENVRVKTEKEWLKLEIERMHECFKDLSGKMETIDMGSDKMITNTSERLERCFEQVYKMKSKGKKKTKWFWRK